ncbi:phage minor head protein [Comamonas odontotermitis]|uniref:phage head morphogenesis protein n=1 Tax=Comamonas odontotermitis TaxID=379895 RepID=UPI00366A7852
MRNQQLPYVRYITRRDGRVRAAHQAWDNLTLPVDDDFWKTHWPPNGWRCRCRVMSMTRRDYEQGYTLDRPGAETNPRAPLVKVPLNKQAPPEVAREYVNPRTGEVARVPLGIDPGFAYNPGQARQQALQQQLEAKLKGVAPGLANAARRSGFRED